VVFLITLVCIVVIAALCAKPLKRWPVVFYVLALACTSYYLYASVAGAPVILWQTALPLFQRCLIALALFTLVMFIGVLPEHSKARSLYLPLRRELSILGAIFALGHIVAYVNVFIPRVFNSFFAIDLNLGVSLGISCVLTVLLAVLTVTSFTVVRKKMSAHSWKRIQMFAYPFFLLIFVHLIAVLLPSALAGSQTIAMNLLVYAVLFALYSVLRVRKALRELRERQGIEDATT
jgi:DMSO/TMAO reductase YedYZ heme-binding membrane subunit